MSSKISVFVSWNPIISYLLIKFIKSGKIVLDPSPQTFKDNNSRVVLSKMFAFSCFFLSETPWFEKESCCPPRLTYKSISSDWLPMFLWEAVLSIFGSFGCVEPVQLFSALSLTNEPSIVLGTVFSPSLSIYKSEFASVF